MNTTQIKKLRDETGCGMMDCKDALRWAEGDWDYTIKILKSMCQTVVQRPYLWKVAKEERESNYETKAERSIRHKEYLLEVAELFGVTEDKPFSQVFYFEIVDKEKGNEN